jgi:SHS2 domain-containing protein
MSGPAAGWSHFDHGADIGVRGTGASEAEAFAQAACALTAVVTDLEDVTARDKVAIRCAAPDDTLLLVDWLNAIIYEMATRDMLFSRFELRIEDGRLEAEIWGEPLDFARHRPAVEVKGATLTEARVLCEDGTWTAQCVVDV